MRMNRKASGYRAYTLENTLSKATDDKILAALGSLTEELSTLTERIDAVEEASELPDVVIAAPAMVTTLAPNTGVLAQLRAACPESAAIRIEEPPLRLSSGTDNSLFQSLKRS